MTQSIPETKTDVFESFLTSQNVDLGDNLDKNTNEAIINKQLLNSWFKSTKDKREAMSIYLKSNLVEKINNISKKHNISKSQVIETILEKVL